MKGLGNEGRSPNFSGAQTTTSSTEISPHFWEKRKNTSVSGKLRKAHHEELIDVLQL